MGNVNIQQVEGGELLTIGDNDGIEIDTGTVSGWARFSLFKSLMAAAVQTLTNKTLTTPTIADFTNANHNHQDAAGGGVIGDSFRTRYIITPSVSSNNLTVAIKYIDGTNPSSTKEITFRVGDTEYTLSSATSYTKNAATNWHNAGATELFSKDIDFFVYAIGETGASAGLKFGHSRISHAVTMGDFVNTNTSEKYIAGNWTNFNSTDPVTLIGRFRAQLSASAAFNWSIPNPLVINYPINESEWMDWTPAQSASGSLTWTSPTVNLAKYKIARGRLYWEASVSATLGGTASNHLYLTPPFQSARKGNAIAIGAGFAGSVTGTIWVTAATGFITVDRYDSSNYATAGTLTVDASGYFEI